jgi:hypothetical protein
LYADRRVLYTVPLSPEDRRRQNERLQDGRSTFHVLCGEATIEFADTLVTQLRQVTAAEDGSHDPKMPDLLRQLVEALRAELGSS